jgi:hypothetical protein
MPSDLEVGETLVGGQEYGQTIANINSELSELYSGISGKQDILTFDTIPTDGSTNPVESNGIYDAIKVVKDDVDDINELIPEAASSENQLADKTYVGTEIGTAVTNVGQTITGVNNTLTQHIADTNVHLSEK